MPNFAKLIQGGRFLIAVVAPSQGKKTLIERALEDEPASPVKYRVEAIDELGHLLVNPPRDDEDRRVPGTRPSSSEPDDATGRAAARGGITR